MKRFKKHMQRRAGFTLIEMLVVITIVVVLASISTALYTGMADADRIRSSARQIQSYLEGARDRAILAQKPRGVRFLTDSANPGIVRTMIFIGQTEPMLGRLVINPDGAFNNQTVKPHQITDPKAADYVPDNQRWSNLKLRGLLKLDARIRIYDTQDLDPNGQPATSLVEQFRITAIAGEQMTIDGIPTFADNDGTESGPFIYELDLAPAVLPNQEPVELGPGIAIDLAASSLPGTWTPAGDIMFSPRGTVVGPEAAQGLIHFMLRDVVDIENGRAVSDPALEGDELIVTVFTRTGHISSHPVYNEDANGNGVADMPGEDSNGNGVWDGPGVDQFYFAETGEVAQ